MSVSKCFGALAEGVPETSMQNFRRDFAPRKVGPREAVGMQYGMTFLWAKIEIVLSDTVISDSL